MSDGPRQAWIARALGAAELIQACVSRHDLMFHFHPPAKVQVLSTFAIEDSNGHRTELPDICAAAPLFLKLLSCRIVDVSWLSPSSLSLSFDNGSTLHLWRSEPPLKCFAIFADGKEAFF